MLNRLLGAAGNLLIVSALAGLLILDVSLIGASLSQGSVEDAEELASDLVEEAAEPQPIHLSATEAPITRVEIARIGLRSPVVLSKYLDSDGGTWEIPAFRVGHAEFTAGAGQPGNAVLLGHLTSIGVGQVFRDLNRVRVGD